MKQRLLAGLAAAALLAAAPAGAQVSATEDVLLEADRLSEENDGQIVVAEGNVEARFEGRILRADKLIYDIQAAKVRAVGNVEIINEDGSRQFADELEFDDALENGFATGFANRFAEQGVATAVTARREGGNRNILERVIYTACEVCEDGESPTWSLKARQAVFDEESQMISYRGVTLNIKDVPVFYFPYLTHPDPNSERRSGLLTPDLGLSSKTGLFYQQPYLYVLSESSDITIAPQIMTEVNPLLAGRYRKRFWSGYVDVEGGFTYEKLFDNDGEKFGDASWRSFIAADGRFAINNDWTWGFGLERASDPTFDRRYDVDIEGEGPGLYASSIQRLFSQLFVVGQGDAFYVDAAVVSPQSLREVESDSNLPLVAPAVFAERVFDFEDRGALTIGGSVFAFSGDGLEDVARGGLAAEWRTSRIFGPGLVAEPYAGLRADAFRYEDATGADTSANRSAAYAGVEARWPLWRSGDTVDMLVEPLVNVVAGTPGPNDDRIPSVEGASLVLSSANVLDADPLGRDRIDGAFRIAAGVRGSLFAGPLTVNGFVGQRWRDREDPTLARAGLDRQTSDTVGEVGFEWGRGFAFTAAYQYDNEAGDLVSADYAMRIRTDRLSLRAEYYEAQGLTRDISAYTVRGQYEFAENWFAVFLRTEDIERDALLDQRIGFAFEDDCTRFEVVYQRRDDLLFGSDPSESIRFRVSLATLGQFGANDFD